jgi:hypothetical protein
VLPFFFRLPVLRMVAHPELSTHAVDLADTHMHAEPLLKLCLDDGTWRMRSRSTGGFEPGSSRSTQRSGMTLPPVLQGNGSLDTNGAKQAVGHSTLYRHWRVPACLLKRVTFQKRGDQPLSGLVAFVALHLSHGSLLSHLFQKRASRLFETCCARRRRKSWSSRQGFPPTESIVIPPRLSLSSVERS